MKTETLTKRIFDQSDQALRNKLEDSVKWIWDETGHNAATRPESVAVELLNEAMKGTAMPQFKEMPWIGAISKLLVETAFLYLRESYRNRAVSDFMQKVESVEGILRSEN